MQLETPHTPPGFQQQSKPHVCRANGEWWVVWPHRAAMPDADTLESKWRPYMNRLNGITLPRDTSVLVFYEGDRLQ
jgi:hypothetical protein